jgi:hypothetical protein
MKRRMDLQSDACVPASGRSSLLGGLKDAVRAFVCELRDPYRPELHYMRGPGPKSQAAAERMSSSH